ncbi:hypothetical protein [Algoriphagus mannitolivorans]|uniref:hypothetical protein n=1 Tax=Algoriphagus mannitolivorans TaxID=226504 RepID=UPI0003F68EF1|nr:hypothetical protein [Algoriphagus mannitolivorans]
MKIYRYLVIALFVGLGFSCAPSSEKVEMEKLPYFDLKSFMNLEISKLDSVLVTKTSRINGKESIVDTVYSQQDFKEEFEVFYQADINLPSLATSYSTDAKYDYLVHKLLPEAKGKVKEIVVRYHQSYPSSITIKMKEENLFYSTTTIGELYMSQLTNKVDHYTIETTQKVIFLDPTNIKIQGILK